MKEAMLYEKLSDDRVRCHLCAHRCAIPDGKKGMNLFREQLPHLVITDLIMPEKEGIETITELRQEFPEVKIIAMTGGGRVPPELYLRVAKRLGAMRTFAKPIEREELLKAIQELLK